ncbi:MAG: hypothetical protein RIQ60_3720 [Pseudomonadota bacterium]|jgi:uncharacterized membrane protein
MHKARLEAFSDGVIAIILTIMVLELKVPKEPTLEALAQLWPVWVAYALSYYNVFVLWVAHHEAFGRIGTVSREVLFANGLFLFCVSLIPFATAFAGEEHWLSALPVGVYGLVMLSVSLTFGRLRMKMAAHSTSSDAQVAAHHLSEGWRSYRQAFFFLVGAASAWAHPRIGLILFVAIPVALRVLRSFQGPAARAV